MLNIKSQTKYYLKQLGRNIVEMQLFLAELQMNQLFTHCFIAGLLWYPLYWPFSVATVV